MNIQIDQKYSVGSTVRVRIGKTNVLVMITEYHSKYVNKYCGRLLENADEIKLTKGSSFLFPPDVILVMEEC